MDRRTFLQALAGATATVSSAKAMKVTLPNSALPDTPHPARYFEDIAGTIPARINGPVGRIVFGDGDLVAPSDFARPTLGEDGMLWFDGLDDALIRED